MKDGRQRCQPKALFTGFVSDGVDGGMGVDGLDWVRTTGWKVRRVMVLTTLVTYSESMSVQEALVRKGYSIDGNVKPCKNEMTLPMKPR